jgi:hypothetical protein
MASLVLISTAACGVRIDHHTMFPEDANTAAATPPILLFNGTGASSNDVAAVEAILKNNHLSYSSATSSQLNRMDQSKIGRYHLLIVPGGNFVEIGNSLTPGATGNIRKAVGNGLNYLGICGGGFFAGKYDSPYNGLNLTSGVRDLVSTRLRIVASTRPRYPLALLDRPRSNSIGRIVQSLPAGVQLPVDIRMVHPPSSKGPLAVVG